MSHSHKGGKMSLKGDKMSSKGGKKRHRMSLGVKMESVRLKISGHMTSVGEEILCVLEKHTSVDVCGVRVLVLERLSVAAEWMCSFFQREIETLHHTAAGGGSVEKKKKESEGKETFKGKTSTDFVAVRTEEVPVEQQERKPSLVQEDPQPQDADGSTLTLPAVKSVHNDKNRETEPVASTSTEHMKTQAYIAAWVPSQPTSDDELLSSHCSDSDIEGEHDGDDENIEIYLSNTSSEQEGDDWESSGEGQSALNSLTSHNTGNVEGDSNMSRDLETTSTRICIGKKSFCCTDCGKVFNQKGHLKRHTLIHLRKKGSNCTLCGCNLKCGKDKPFVCQVCGKGCSQKGDLKTHMRTHTGEKPFVCNVCGRGCSLKGDLTRHMRTHTKEKPFMCTVCGKSFSKSSYISMHMRTHTGERPFTCTVCGKGCISRPQLKKHLRTHTGEKPYTCKDCGKNFRRTEDMKRHMMTHTGEKPFTCNVCDKGFNRSHHLSRHMRTHTGEKPFTCNICGKDCSQKGDLKRHMRTHTGGEI